MRLSSTELKDQLRRVRELESLLTFRLSVLGKILDRQAVDLLKGTTVNLTSYRVLTVVGTLGAISISDISRFTALDRAQISRTAEALGRRGLVEFSTDPNSKRKKIVRLTAEGLALLSEINPRFLERNQTLNECLGPEDGEALRKGLTRLSDLLSK